MGGPGSDTKIRRAKSNEPIWSIKPEPMLMMASKTRFLVQKPRSTGRQGPEAEQERNQDIHRQQIKRQQKPGSIDE